MAGRKTVASKAVENTEEVITESTTVDDVESTKIEKVVVENTDNTSTELLKMLKDLQEEVTLLKSQKEVVVEEPTKTQESNLTRTVKVISMMNNSYNLSTEPLGKGKLYNFARYGDFKNIKFSDLQDIMNHFGYQFEKGMAILASKADYDDLQMGYVYDDILNQESMEKLLKLNSFESISLIEKMDKDMQDNIMSLVADRIANGSSYDLNIIEELKSFTQLEESIKIAKENKEQLG